MFFIPCKYVDYVWSVYLPRAFWMSHPSHIWFNQFYCSQRIIEIMDLLIMELSPPPCLVCTHIFFSNFPSYMVFRIVWHPLLLSVKANFLGNDKITTPILLGQFLTTICISNSSLFVWLGLCEVWCKRS